MNTQEALQNAIKALNIPLDIKAEPHYFDVETDEAGNVTGDIECFNIHGVYLSVRVIPDPIYWKVTDPVYKREYSIYKEEHFPGSYEEPPYTDIIDDQTYTSLSEAFGRVMQLIAVNVMDSILEWNGE